MDNKTAAYDDMIAKEEELATAIQETMHDLFLERIVPEEVGPAMYEKFENILSRY